MQKAFRLAVDIGGPIIDCPPGSLPERYLASEQTPKAFFALRVIADLIGPDDIAILSQCDVHVEAAKRAWFEKKDFHRVTRIPYGNVRFCREPEGKAAICKTYGISRQVDDRPHILDFGLDIVEEQFLFAPKPEEVAAFPAVAAKAVIVPDWDTLLPLLLESLRRRP